MARSTIICVDDEKMMLTILSEQLNQWFGTNYTIEKALSGEEALLIIDDCISENIEVSLVISDYIMPNMKGDEFLKRVREKDEKIKKIMLTGYSSPEGIINAINYAGLYRYIKKPWDAKDMMLTCVEAIRLYEQEKKMDQYAKGFETLYKANEKTVADLSVKVNKMAEAFATAIDFRSAIVAGHSKRVAKYSAMIGKEMNMPEEDLKNLELMALLHDIGRIGLSDSDMLKINEKSSIKEDLLADKLGRVAEHIIGQMYDNQNILSGIKYHIERFDGSGHYGLSKEDIPLEARIIAVANYFDILKSSGKKEDRLSLETIYIELTNLKKTFFDPLVVEAFMRIMIR